jgi:hypothetical protein
VPVRDTADAFDQLSQTINRMLQQIQQMVEGVRNTVLHCSSRKLCDEQFCRPRAHQPRHQG